MKKTRFEKKKRIKIVHLEVIRLPLAKTARREKYADTRERQAHPRQAILDTSIKTEKGETLVYLGHVEPYEKDDKYNEKDDDDKNKENDK